MLKALCILSVIFGVKSSLAPFIKPCQINDFACMKASAQVAVPVVAPGIPELGINSLDPLKLDLIKGDQAGLELTFKDTVITGLKNCIVENLKVDLTKGKQAMTIRCSVDMTGNYKLGGQLLILPVQGQGKYTINIQDIIIKASTDLETVQGADGKPHWHINKWRHSYNVKSGTQFQFDNLFNGNQILAGPVLTFLNSSWRDVMQEVAPPIVRAIVEAVVNTVKTIYKTIPADELYIQ